MSDYIKELNIIDFLGVIVPGCVLVLLLTGDNTELLLWADYFGADANPIVRGVFLVIAGYLAGMVLHEIGDLIEKGLWCFTPFDPKAYAANAVGIGKINAAMKAANIKDEHEDTPEACCVLPSWFRGIMGALAMAFLLVACTVGFACAMNSSVRSVSGSQIPLMTMVTGKQSFNFSWGFFGGLIGGCCLLAIVLYMNNRGKTTADPSKEDENKSAGANDPQPQPSSPAPLDRWKALKEICSKNPQIQTYLATKGFHSKQSMFDSFRHVMRNLLICVAIINVFSIWYPVDLYQDIATQFAKSADISGRFCLLSICFCCVVVFAFCRYQHFAYLRYKYGFERFVTKVKATDDPEVAHHHIKCEFVSPQEIG